MNYLITVIIAGIALVGSFLPKTSIWDKLSDNLGATSFPTSLDSLTNPSGTDSVATVSHSSQHSNANDAIEAIEAKVGTGASTPTANTVFFGNGVGTSAWSATPSLTTLTLSGLGTFGSFISNASSTVIGNFNITGNSTSTNATTTNFFTTLASSTSTFGSGLGTCVANSFVTWTGGKFGCDTDDTGSLSINYLSHVATSSTSANLTRGPFNVTPGSTFIVLGKIGVITNGASARTILLEYKQGTESASTTLDTTEVVLNTANDKTSVSVQGVFIATTTTTVLFNVSSSGVGSNTWSSLIVLPL